MHKDVSVSQGGGHREDWGFREGVARNAAAVGTPPLWEPLHVSSVFQQRGQLGSTRNAVRCLGTLAWQLCPHQLLAFPTEQNTQFLETAPSTLKSWIICRMTLSQL